MWLPPSDYNPEKSPALWLCGVRQLESSHVKFTVMRQFFGTDGIRGRAGEFPLQPEALVVIGATISKVLAARVGRVPRLLIGGDTRESSPWIAAAVAQGITQAGGTVSCAGIIPTPGIAYLTRAEGFDAGIVISASHNPFHDNGIKLFSASGEKMTTSWKPPSKLPSKRYLLHRLCLKPLSRPLPRCGKTQPMR